MRRRTGMPAGISPRIVKVVVGGIAALVAGLLASQQPQKSPQELTTMKAGEYHRVIYANDGDTIKLDNGERVRLIGIDTPESHENPKMVKDVKRTGKDRQTLLAMGSRAANFTKTLVNERQVRLEFDVEPRDHYGRVLAYVYLQDGTFVNEKIIREGYAYPLTIPPNVRHAKEFKRWFDEAQENKRGLWK